MGCCESSQQSPKKGNDVVQTADRPAADDVGNPLSTNMFAVYCPSGHQLKVSSGSYECYAIKESEGVCKSDGDTAGKTRWQCSECNFDSCGPCYNAKLLSMEAMTSEQRNQIKRENELKAASKKKAENQSVEKKKRDDEADVFHAKIALEKAEAERKEKDQKVKAEEDKKFGKNITKYLQESRSNPSLLIVGLQRFALLKHPKVSSSDPDVESLRADGCFELIFDILLENMSNADVTKAASDACIAAIREYKDGKRVAEHPSALKGIVCAMRSYSSDVEVMRSVIQVVERITYAYSDKKIVESGVMEEVVAAVKSHVLLDASVCKFGVSAIKNLANMYAYPMGEKGALDATIAAMKAYPDDADIYQVGCKALEISCWNGHHDNKARIEALGAFPLIVELLRKHISNECNGSSVICATVIAICGPSNVSFPIPKDNRRSHDESNPKYARLLGSFGACEAVLALLANNKYPNWYTHVYLETLSGLALCEENQARLLSLGVFAHLKAILDAVKPDTRNETVGYACELIRRMCHGSRDAQAAWYTAGGCEAAMEALGFELAYATKYPQHYNLKEAVCDSIICLSSLSEDCCARLGSLNVFETVIELLKVRPDSPELNLCGCRLIIALGGNTENKVKLFDMAELLPILQRASAKFAKKTSVNGRNLDAMISETIARVTRADGQTSLFEIEAENARVAAERKAEEDKVKAEEDRIRAEEDRVKAEEARVRAMEAESERLAKAHIQAVIEAEVEKNKKLSASVPSPPKKGIMDKFKAFKEAEERRLAAEAEPTSNIELDRLANEDVEEQGLEKLVVNDILLASELNKEVEEGVEAGEEDEREMPLYAKIDAEIDAEVEKNKKVAASSPSLPKKGIMDKFKVLKEAATSQTEKTKEEGRTIILGLDSAGKTALLYKLILGEVITTIPTIGFNVESFKNQTVWDIGGQKAIRPLWVHYFSESANIAFCIDLSDGSRYVEAMEELDALLADERLAKKNFYLILTKSDLVSDAANTTATATATASGPLYDLIRSRSRNGLPLQFYTTSIVDGRGIDLLKKSRIN